MIKARIRDLIQNNDPLSAMIHDFNVWPTRYAHHSWYDSIGDYGQLKTLMRSERVEQKVAALILENIGNEFFYEFSKVTQAIGLLDRPGIEQLIWYAGLAVHCKQIIHYGKHGESSNDVRQAIGEAAFHFSVHQAPLLAGSMHFDFMEDLGEGAFVNAIKSSGRRLLALTLSDHPSAIKSRIKLKFPKSMNWYFPINAKISQVRNAQILTRKILLQEMVPSWRGLLS